MTCQKNAKVNKKAVRAILMDAREKIIDAFFGMRSMESLLKMYQENLAKTKSAKKQKELQEDIVEIKKNLRIRRKAMQFHIEYFKIISRTFTAKGKIKDSVSVKLMAKAAD